MANSTSPTRRTVVKGAAWATPALVVASSIPAIAASVDPTELCETEADDIGWYGQDTDVIAWTRTIGTDPSTTPGRKGSFFDVRLGTWQFKLAGTKFEALDISGYQVNWKPGLPIVLRSIDLDKFNASPVGGPPTLVEGPKDSSGNSEWTGRFTWTPNSGPLVKSAGLVFTGSVQTDVPYWNCAGNKAAQNLLVSVPFTLTFLKGLKQADLQPVVTCETTYYWNAVLYTGDGCTTYSNKEKKNWVSGGLPEVTPAS